ncbi:hypothetical protein B0H16DRAFT_1780974 [Mycena metata]|uniref:Uncharacterized protein n=1 Tax=Mycena metata TaxID=1033252 RepID=A0AAD7NNI1_9AGAR|nr:hypothetical protein B0H16DRAFT_1780974 [Mycena metata]
MPLGTSVPFLVTPRVRIRFLRFSRFSPERVSKPIRYHPRQFSRSDEATGTCYFVYSWIWDECHKEGFRRECIVGDGSEESGTLDTKHGGGHYNRCQGRHWCWSRRWRWGQRWGRVLLGFRIALIHISVGVFVELVTQWLDGGLVIFVKVKVLDGGDVEGGRRAGELSAGKGRLTRSLVTGGGGEYTVR